MFSGVGNNPQEGQHDESPSSSRAVQAERAGVPHAPRIAPHRVCSGIPGTHGQGSVHGGSDGPCVQLGDGPCQGWPPPPHGGNRQDDAGRGPAGGPDPECMDQPRFRHVPDGMGRGKRGHQALRSGGERCAGRGHGPCPDKWRRRRGRRCQPPWEPLLARWQVVQGEGRGHCVREHRDQ